MLITRLQYFTRVWRKSGEAQNLCLRLSKFVCHLLLSFHSQSVGLYLQLSQATVVASVLVPGYKRCMFVSTILGYNMPPSPSCYQTFFQLTFNDDYYCVHSVTWDIKYLLAQRRSIIAQPLVDISGFKNLD